MNHFLKILLRGFLRLFLIALLSAIWMVPAVVAHYAHNQYWFLIYLVGFIYLLGKD